MAIKTFLVRHWFDFTVICCILIFSLAVWLPTRFLPFHWDSATYIYQPALKLSQRNFLPFTLDGWSVAQPPLMAAFLALCWQLFDRSLLVSHLTQILFLPILLTAAYFLGKKTLSAFGGVLLAALVGFTPVVLAESGNIFIDLPAAALALTAITLWLYHRRQAAVIIYTLALLTNLSVFIVLPFFIIHHRYTAKEKRLKDKVVALLSTGIWLPLLVLVFWFGYHYQATGWLLFQSSRSQLFTHTLYQLFQAFARVLSDLFLTQSRWLVAIALFLGAVQLYSQNPDKLFKHPLIMPLTGTLIFGILAFSVSGVFTLRYGILLLPLFYLLAILVTNAAVSAIKPLPQPAVFLAAVSVWLLAFLYQWYPAQSDSSGYDFRPPADISYINTIHTFRQLGAFVHVNSFKTEWYGGYPEIGYFSHPDLGYINTAVSINKCQNYAAKPSQKQLLILHAYSPEQVNCRQLLTKLETRPIARFEKDGKWVEIYEVVADASSSAKPQ